MKIVGVILILLGLLLFVGGIGAAVVNRATVGQNFNCETAERYKSEMDAAYRTYQEAKGTAMEAEAEKAFRTKATGLDIASKGCAERNQEYFYYFLGLVGIGIIGFFMIAFGVVLILLRRRGRARTA